jgi:hypothetical protein
MQQAPKKVACLKHSRPNKMKWKIQTISLSVMGFVIEEDYLPSLLSSELL